MESYARLRDEISQIRSYVLLNLFGLDCRELNTEMYNRCLSLRIFHRQVFYNTFSAMWVMTHVCTYQLLRSMASPPPASTDIFQGTADCKVLVKKRQPTTKYY
jgi:hypothetical protein